MVEGQVVLKACGFKEWQRGSEPLRLEALMSLKTHLIFNPFFLSILEDKFRFMCRNMDILLKFNFCRKVQQKGKF